MALCFPLLSKVEQKIRSDCTVILRTVLKLYSQPQTISFYQMMQMEISIHSLLNESPTKEAAAHSDELQNMPQWSEMPKNGDSVFNLLASQSFLISVILNKMYGKKIDCLSMQTLNQGYQT